MATSLDEPKTVYACMLSLENIVWDYAGLFDAAAPEASSIVGYTGVAMSALKGEMYAPNLVAFQLWERGNYIHAWDKFNEMYRAHLVNTNASEAKRLTTEEYVQEVCDSQINKDSQISSRGDIEEAVRHILHRGDRWRSLVDAVGSAELLLMDDRFHIGVRKAIGDIIKDGTSQEFDKLKNDLLLPEGHVRDICMTLTGVSEMIFQLSDSAKDSEIRQYLANAITGRFRHIFGQRGPDTRRDPDRKVVNSLDYLLRSIVDIFGISIRFTKAARTLTDAEINTLSVDEQYKILAGESHENLDMHDSMVVEELQGSSILGPTPPGNYAGLSPGNEFLHDWLE